MLRMIVCTFCGFLWVQHAFAQQMNLTDVLDAVVQNNEELNALSMKLDGRKRELKAQNNLPDPQVGFYYLPLSDHTGDDYTEFQVSQTLEFPTVYGVRSNLITEQIALTELEFDTKRQAVLHQAKLHCLQLVYLDKMLQVENSRVNQAKKIHDQLKALFESQQVGVLELNKAKIAWFQKKFAVEQLRKERAIELDQLIQLNGGNPIEFQDDYPTDFGNDSMEELWAQVNAKDPQLIELSKTQTIAEQSLKLSKSKALPNLTIGFNRQGVSSAYYSGLFAGLSIPIWSNHHKVKAAELNIGYQSSYKQFITSKKRSQFDIQYKDFQSIKSSFMEYQSIISTLNSEELLMKSHELGEISFLVLYSELQFYWQAIDQMLEMEYQLYVSQSILLKHQL